MQSRLDLASLGSVPAGYRPAVAPGDRRVGIVHLGIGAFHRAHQAYYTEECGDWGICGITQRSTAVVDQLGPQDGLYTLLVREGTEARPRVMGAVREVLFAGDDPLAVAARIADPAVSVVTLTVSEKGYRHDPATRRLRLDDPEIAADLGNRPARTVIGQLVAGLAARAASGAGPVNVVCCDNLPDNGPTVRGLVHAYAAAYDPALTEWIDASVAFPATMVDRIVPAATGTDRAEAASLIGLADQGTVVAEPFTQWVIEDSFAAPRPAWEKAGAQIVSSVAPYEKVKLRLLNGAHSALAYLGGLAGHEYIASACEDDAFASFAHSLMVRDAALTVDAPPGMETEEYAGSVLRRFRNAALKHTTRQVSMDGSQKLPQRLLGTVTDRLAAGQPPSWAALAVAGWMRHVWTQRSETGAPFAVNDPLAGVFASRLAGADDAPAVVDALLGIRDVFGPLSESPEFRALLTDHLARLASDGARAAVLALGR
ncbi:MAG: mannitol dehydrogenase family protein [Streptosporangiales bacterium]|nr:mannitol dehydrogenase family protein [Streptosporangiales bacterium]